MFLIVACSKNKSNISRGKARDLYTGQLFLKSAAYADKHGLELYIVSAKYGLIKGDTIINTYNEKLKKPYEGPWPDGKGLYVGGRALYFKNVPDTITPLMPEVLTEKGFAYGRQLQCMNKLLK